VWRKSCAYDFFVDYVASLANRMLFPTM
jgi:hypothetical protein